MNARRQDVPRLRITRLVAVQHRRRRLSTNHDRLGSGIHDASHGLPNPIIAKLGDASIVFRDFVLRLPPPLALFSPRLVRRVPSSHAALPALTQAFERLNRMVRFAPREPLSIARYCQKSHASVNPYHLARDSRRRAIPKSPSRSARLRPRLRLLDAQRHVPAAPVLGEPDTADVPTVRKFPPRDR